MEYNRGLNENILYQQRKTLKNIEEIKEFKHRVEYFKLKKYLDDFIENKSKERFIVFSGLRGLGKTTIFYQLYNYLLNKQEVLPKNLLYISMDSLMDFFDTNLLNTIENYLYYTFNKEMIYLEDKFFIFVDESHLDKKWALSGKIIYDSTKNIFLIFSGSSALNLDISADIARRIKKEQIFSLNFSEYLYLKHDISFDCNISKILSEMIYFGLEDNIKKAKECEDEIYKKMLYFNNNPNFELESFLKSYGFPFSLDDDEEAYEKINSTIGSIIEKDIPSFKEFLNSTKTSIRKIITYIALQGPGETSVSKIANYLSLSPNKVSEILNILEKSQLIFNVKPYGGSSKILRKPWKYYFLSPSIKSAINFYISRYNLDNPKYLEVLAENMVASGLYKMQKTIFPYMGLFYSPLKGGSDFLIKTKLSDIVPIEVGIGRKTKSQLKKDMSQYNSKYGILVSNRFPRIQVENNIIHIPLMIFGFI